MSKTESLHNLQTEVSRLRQENKDLREELSLLRSSVRSLRELRELIESVSPNIDLTAWTGQLLASALAAVSASDGSLILLDEESSELVFAVVHGKARERLAGYRMRSEAGLAGWVVRNRVPDIISDPLHDARFNREIDEMLGFRTHGIVCVPLIAGERVLGVIEAINKLSDRDFTTQDQDLMMVVAHLATAGILRAESFVD